MVTGGLVKNCIFLAVIACLFSSCNRRLGHGILLWSIPEPSIPSGTVLPVYIKSNIDSVWVVGIPREYRDKQSKINKLEIPLAKLELVGGRSRTMRRANEFAPYALSYAETLQDGLPIRDDSNNNARRVYRLRQGEIIKILSSVRGVPVIGGTGDPLPGEWYRVLTEDGTIGYCFSYRLSLMQYDGAVITAVPRDIVDDPELDRLLSQTWVAEFYRLMVNGRRLDLDELNRNWGFDPGLDTGIARIRTSDLERSFSYTSIRPTGINTWRFEGTTLRMSLRNDTTLSVQYTEDNGLLRSVIFVTLPTSIPDLVIQETARREALFNIVYSHGPDFTSHNFGDISFTEGSRFTWTGYEFMIPQLLPAAALGNGHVEFKLFLSDDLSQRYSGAFTLRFNGVSGSRGEVDFLYSLENQGLRLEHIPDTGRNGINVNRRSLSPIIYEFTTSETSTFNIQDSFLLDTDNERHEIPADDNFEYSFFDYSFDDFDYGGDENTNNSEVFSNEPEFNLFDDDDDDDSN